MSAVSSRVRTSSIGRPHYSPRNPAELVPRSASFAMHVLADLYRVVDHPTCAVQTAPRTLALGPIARQASGNARERLPASAFARRRSGWDGSESRPATKAELLDTVVGILGDRERVSKAQWPERRVPDDADADRGPDNRRIIHDQGLSSLREAYGTLVPTEPTRVGEYRAANADILGKEAEGVLKFEARAPVVGAAEGIHGGPGRDVARPNTSRGKAADQGRPHLEMIQHA